MLAYGKGLRYSWEMQKSNAQKAEIDVLIQGAGIAGLTLAAGLIKRGYRVLIVERTSASSEIGAGIWMAPNALQVFKSFGLIAKMEAIGWPIHQVELRDFKGQCLSSLETGRLKDEFGFHTLAFHRAELQAILVESVGSDNIRLSTEIETWTSEGDGLKARLSSGEEIQAKIIIGADGLHSKIRAKLFPQAVKRYSGTSSYRAVIDTPMFKESDPHASQEIWAPGCRFGYSRLSNERTYWYLTFDARPEERETPQQMKSRALRLAGEYFQEFSGLIESAADDAILRTDISDLKPLDSWSLDRVGLMGDAAHATTPNLGQGGAQAVEDAYALQAAIERHGLSPQALEAYFNSRQKKAHWIVETSRSYGRFCHQKNPLARALRNGVFRMLPPSVTQSQLRRIYRLEA